jgi:hypothetical protein
MSKKHVRRMLRRGAPGRTRRETRDALIRTIALSAIEQAVSAIITRAFFVMLGLNPDLSEPLRPGTLCIPAPENRFPALQSRAYQILTPPN